MATLHPIMKLSAALVFLLLPATALLHADPPASPAPAPHCAFADERFMTITNICVFASVHYLAHHRWPQSCGELQTQARRLNTKREADEFFARFSRLDLQPQGRSLRLDMRFRASGQVHSQSVVLHPGESTDAILQAATEPPAT